MKKDLQCPQCGATVASYRNPTPTVDIIIELESRHEPGPVVLIKRNNPPYGWAIPGGFVDYGESVEQAARREAKEETGLDVHLLAQIGVYSKPDRDPRQHTQTTVFAAKAQGTPKAGDDAGQAAAYSLDDPPRPLCFDHGRILDHYRAWRLGLRPAAPVLE